MNHAANRDAIGSDDSPVSGLLSRGRHRLFDF